MVSTAPATNRSVVALLVVGVLCLGAVGVGWAVNRDDDDAAAQWADSVCGSLQEWRDTIDDAADSVEGGTPEDAGGVTTLDDAYFDVRDATSRLATDLRAIGAPDTDAGAVVGDRLRQLSERLDSLVGQLLGAASSTDVITSAEGLRGLGDQVVGIVTELGDTDAAGELGVALREQGSCRALTPSGA
ncbi:MAG TPA: hypothetical protein VFZ83_15180 [Acidimicrobiia bacterium]|nr:hypothetical protein [Acidimicrobiia bacterium]